MSQSSALLLSICVEAAVAWPLVSALHWGSGARAAAAAAVGTLCTHWLAWNAMLQLLDVLAYPAAAGIAEAGVVVVESIAYRVLVPLAWPKALVASFIANAASTGFGLLLYALRLA